MRTCDDLGDDLRRPWPEIPGQSPGGGGGCPVGAGHDDGGAGRSGKTREEGEGHKKTGPGRGRLVVMDSKRVYSETVTWAGKA